ncbi:MAG: nucleotidyltransferase family protein [Patescibacteria group bacterium]
MATDQIISTIKPILQKYGVTKSDLFGSYARGDFNDRSDVDILIDPPENMSLFGLARLQSDLMEALGKDVDVVTYDSVNKYLKKYIFQSTSQIL